MVLTLFSVVLISWIGLHLHCLVFPPRFRARCTRIKWWMWSAARAHLFPLGCLPRHPAVRSLMARCPEPPDWWWTEPLTGEGEMPAWGANVPTHSNTTHRLPEMCTRLLNIPYLFLSRLELTPVESCVFLYYFDNWFLFFNGNFKIAYMVKRTYTQATRSCISYRGGKKIQTQSCYGFWLLLKRVGYRWTDGKMKAEDPAQIWLGVFGPVVWPMLPHCHFGLRRCYWQVAGETKWTSCQTRPEEKPASEAQTVDSYLRLTRRGRFPCESEFTKMNNFI